MIEMSVRWLPVLVATLAHMVLGAAWFGVFAKPWSALAHPGKSQEQIAAGPKWIYGIAAGGGLVSAIVLDAVLRSLAVDSVGAALAATVALWVGFVAVKYATTYAFEYRPWTLLAIDAGYPLASMLVMALVFGFWP